MCAVDQRRLAVALEREEAGFEVEDVTDALGAGVHLAGPSQEEHTGQRDAGDQGELRRFPPFLDPVFGHRADVIGAMALAE